MSRGRKGLTTRANPRILQSVGSTEMKTIDNRSAIIRTERGLTITGTRITLYDVMDYVTAGWDPERIRNILNLTQTQIADVLGYIDAHRREVEAEYRVVLAQAEENRRYWEGHNRDRFARIAALPSRSDHATLRAKIQEKKSELGLP